MTLVPNFCIAPFFQLTTHPSRSFSPCPYLGGTVWHQKYDTIKDQWNSRELESLRKRFHNNERSSICNRCWNEEDNGKRSLRLRLFDPVNKTSDFAFINETIINERLENNNYRDGISVLTIKNGNVCNAKCRVCHPNDSSRWISDAAKLHELTGKTHYRIREAETNWTDEQIEEIFNMSKSLIRLELFGGEPAYNKNVAILLSKLVESGLSKNIVLYINTNGSIDVTERFQNLKDFKRVEIGVSIDGVGKQFEYIRHGIAYESVVENVKKWIEYFESNNSDYTIDSISTVEIFNIYYLPELKKELSTFLPRPPFWNLLVQPDFLYIRNMPAHVKSAVLEKLSDDSGFADICSVIRQPEDMEKWEQFLEVTNALDSIRGENFREVFPEFSSIIDNS